MSKLIYSQTSTLIEGTYEGIKNRDLAVNPVYYSVAFTGDGYLYTHGRKFRLFNVVDNAVEGLLFQIQNGLAGFYIDGTSVGTGTVVLTVTGDAIVGATTTNGAVAIAHTEFLTDQQVGSYGSSTQIPIITVNKSGHITSVSNSSTIDVSLIRADATTATGQYHPVGVTNSNLQNPLYHSSYYFDGQGNVYANNYYIGNLAISALFSPYSHLSVYATDSTYGHVKLSDSADINLDVDEHYAVTPKALLLAINSSNLYSQDLFAAQDAMVFIGTVRADGVITSHNSTAVQGITDGTSTLSNLNYKVGWTLRFVTAGTYQGEDVEIGDMIIAVKARSTDFDITDWTIIQTNISGALTATSNLNGLLYASNSRIVLSLALSNGILKYNGSTLSFVNPNTLWRDILVNSNSIGTNILNILSGNYVSLTENNGEVTIGVNAGNILATSSYLNIEQDQVRFRYLPTSESTLTIGNGLSLSVEDNDYTLAHAAGTVFTNKLGGITTDAYGHVIAINEVISIPNPNSIVFKENDGTTFLTYDGSVGLTLIFADGNDLSFSSSTDINDNIVLTPSLVHRYRPIQFYGTTSSLSATSVLANNVSTAFTLIGGDNVTLSAVDSFGQALPDGSLMINADDTWRDIQAYKFLSNTLSRSSVGDVALKFSNDFLYSSEEIGIMWTEIDENGNVSYVR